MHDRISITRSLDVPIDPLLKINVGNVGDIPAFLATLQLYLVGNPAKDLFVPPAALPGRGEIEGPRISWTAASLQLVVFHIVFRRGSVGAEICLCGDVVDFFPRLPDKSL